MDFRRLPCKRSGAAERLVRILTNGRVVAGLKKEAGREAGAADGTGWHDKSH